LWYALYEINRASLEPLRLAVRASARLCDHPLNPVSYTPLGRSYCLACDVIDSVIGAYGPEGLNLIKLDAIRRKMAARFRADAERVEAKILPFTRPHRAAS
jgi:poly(3-hydroxybutyrate) depolymerase